MALHGFDASSYRAQSVLAAPAHKENFYLAGGIAVGLHFGHRRSVDLVWFRATRIPKPIRLAQRLKRAGARVQVVSAYTLLKPTTYVESLDVEVASLEDLGCMKLSAIADRGAKKDFIDLYYIASEIPLERLLNLYRRKFRVKDAGPVIMALAYFDDADDERMPTLLRRVSWSSVKQSFRRWVRAL